VVCYGRLPRRSGRRGDGPSVGAVTTAEGVFVWKGAIQNIPQTGRFVKRCRTGILLSVRHSLASPTPLPRCSLRLASCSLRLATYDLLQFLHHFLHPPRIRVQVAGRGGQAGVPQHHLQRRQVAPRLQEARGKPGHFAVPTGIRSRTWAPTRMPAEMPDNGDGAGQVYLPLIVR